MQTSNKRKRSTSQKSDKNEKVKVPKQSSIASFFAVPTKKEPVESELIPEVADPVEMEESVKEEEEEDLSDKKEFYETSMYTDEFNTMLETVLKDESFLFSVEEIHKFDTYKHLSVEPQHLIVRLIMRKHGWFRADNLRYQDNISNMELAIAKLVKAGFLSMKLNDFKEALNLLSKNELKEIAKEKKIVINEANPRKSDYILAILSFALDTSSNIVTHYSQNGSDDTKKEKLWNTINSYLGPCIRVNDDLFKLVQRLQIVYYRINMMTDSNAISTSILAKTSKRNYPEYTACRSNAIWRSRDDLLKYEEALHVEREYEKSIEQLMVYNASKTKKVLSAENGDNEVRNLMIKSWTLCEDRIGLWDDCIAERENEGDSVRPYYMRRFESGWIYTRLLDHGTELLGKLHEYELEAIVLQKLIDQRFYRLGKRGKWYTRLALVQSNYLNKEQPRLQKKTALKTCIDAIHDPRVHQIHLHGIHKRINRLEKDLCIPRREQHQFDYMTLKKREEITIYGERLSDEATGKKTVWRSDDGSECSVEHVAIEYYKKKGFKGLHCENGVVRMIAVLLFWDVIYAPIPGVFETPYQMAPLDLTSDAFYESRIDIINERLSEIGRGQFKEIIKEVDDRERPKRTVSVGINWKYEQQDILEIAECIGASALASLCQLYFEEFGHRQGGMPDLCCWNFDEKKCLFAEVKGPGDTLSETQKMWIETLAGFNIQVEVCHVKVWRGDDVLLNL